MSIAPPYLQTLPHAHRLNTAKSHQTVAQKKPTKMKDPAFLCNPVKCMAGILAIATAAAGWASGADEKPAAEAKSGRFRCEVILPQREWDVPGDASRQTKIELALEITNTGTGDLLVGRRFMALQIVIRDANGREIESGSVANGDRGPRTADFRVLSPGDSTTFKIDIALGLQDNGSLILGGPDGYGVFRYFYPKGTGAYGIQVQYRFIPETGFRIPGPNGTSIPVSPQHLVPINFTSENLAVTIGNEKHKQPAADQPAARPEPKPEGGDKPHSKPEGRPR